MEFILVVGFIVVAFIFMAIIKTREIVLERTLSQGILIQGEHYKVYKICRSSSYTDGGVYVTHHEVRYFGELMLISPQGVKLHISESHLRYCLKVRKHKNSKEIEGRMSKRWAEWKIDPNGNDDVNFEGNVLYKWLY